VRVTASERKHFGTTATQGSMLFWVPWGHKTQKLLPDGFSEDGFAFILQRLHLTKK
jgi:hypothetical protein